MKVLKYSRIFITACILFLNAGPGPVYSLIKSAKDSVNCRSKIMGVYDFDDYGIHLIIITGKSEIYFRHYPDQYSVNRSTWIGKCKFKLRTVSIHDNPEDSNETIGHEWVSDYYKIEGNKLYYRNYSRGKMTNYGYIIKKSSRIPADFREI